VSQILKFAVPAHPVFAAMSVHKILDRTLLLAQHRVEGRQITFERKFQAETDVLDGDVQLDFAPLLHTLKVDGLRLDPTDPNAYRTPWGGLVTSDGREAEVAIAPVTLQPGCTSEIEWRSVVARRTLLEALPDHLRIDGYSTHLNVEVDDDEVVAAGRLFVKRFAPAMMLLLDRSTSPGLLVRPRCGRLELGGEYCHGHQLRAAATFAAAGGLTSAAAVRSRDARRHLPRAVRSRVKPSNIRAGWYVDRRAFGGCPMVQL